MSYTPVSYVIYYRRKEAPCQQFSEEGVKTEMVLLLFSIIGLLISTRLWKWYDSILGNFSLKIRILDICTWGLILCFILAQYKKKLYSFLRHYTWLSGTENFWAYLAQYCNFYAWCSLTVIGFMVIGVLRLFIKSDLFNK